MASAIFGGSLLGIVGRFPARYITAMSGGQALAGIFAALTEICSLWLGASPVVSALLYFVIGDAMLFFSLVSYIFLQKAVSVVVFITCLLLFSLFNFYPYSPRYQEH